jgi:hypothetical protein
MHAPPWAVQRPKGVASTPMHAAAAAAAAASSSISRGRRLDSQLSSSVAPLMVRSSDLETGIGVEYQSRSSTRSRPHPDNSYKGHASSSRGTRRVLSSPSIPLWLSMMLAVFLVLLLLHVIWIIVPPPTKTNLHTSLNGDSTTDYNGAGAVNNSIGYAIIYCHRRVYTNNTIITLLSNGVRGHDIHIFSMCGEQSWLHTIPSSISDSHVHHQGGWLSRLRGRRRYVDGSYENCFF